MGIFGWTAKVGSPNNTFVSSRNIYLNIYLQIYFSMWTLTCLVAGRVPFTVVLAPLPVQHSSGLAGMLFYLEIRSFVSLVCQYSSSSTLVIDWKAVK